VTGRHTYLARKERAEELLEHGRAPEGPRDALHTHRIGGLRAPGDVSAGEPVVPQVREPGKMAQRWKMYTRMNTHCTSRATTPQQRWDEASQRNHVYFFIYIFLVFAARRHKHTTKYDGGGNPHPQHSVQQMCLVWVS